MGAKITCIPFAFPGLPGIRATFTTRQGGESQSAYFSANVSWEVGDDDRAVAKNRISLQKNLGFASWAEARQVHGTDVLVEPEAGAVTDRAKIQADGLTSSRPGQALAVKTADCQPILLAHESGQFIAALHCGWRGNRQDFPQKGVAVFCNAYGLLPETVLAVRGPSLGPRVSEFINFDLEWGEDFREHYDPTAQTVDLWRLTRGQLLEAGLQAERIFSVDLCTHSLPERFFSYRRGKITGRQAGLIWIEKKLL